MATEVATAANGNRPGRRPTCRHSHAQQCPSQASIIPPPCIRAGLHHFVTFLEFESAHPNKEKGIFVNQFEHKESTKGGARKR
eukprot:scaffold108084_cov29-Tisochrysis_lutea.AAC.5